ncbi:hypothetical protein NL485_28910, partial [Klebsiella pneumoniae]|nr:hypothetical protein [Klebsiella pneumoniae]
KLSWGCEQQRFVRRLTIVFVGISRRVATGAVFRGGLSGAGCGVAGDSVLDRGKGYRSGEVRVAPRVADEQYAGLTDADAET